MKVIYNLIFLSLLILNSCKDDNNSIVNPPASEPLDLRLILDTGYNNINIQLYNNGYDSLTTGYNELYITIKKDSLKQTSGNLKFFPKMWMTPTYMHSTAVKNEFQYDNISGYFKGYAIFNMPTSPPNVIWYGVFTFTDNSNNQFVLDSIPLYTSYHSEKQWRFFLDTTDRSTWMISLYKPYTMKKGLNDINIILHKTNEFLINHEQITNAQISISVFTAGSNPEYSSGNVEPVIGSDGMYHGKINLPDETKDWIVCDTIRYNGMKITGNPPPYPTFYFEIK